MSPKKLHQSILLFQRQQYRASRDAFDSYFLDAYGLHALNDGELLNMDNAPSSYTWADWAWRLVLDNWAGMVSVPAIWKSIWDVFPVQSHLLSLARMDPYDFSRDVGLSDAQHCAKLVLDEIGEILQKKIIIGEIALEGDRLLVPSWPIVDDYFFEILAVEQLNSSFEAILRTAIEMGQDSRPKVLDDLSNTAMDKFLLMQLLLYLFTGQGPADDQSRKLAGLKSFPSYSRLRIFEILESPPMPSNELPEFLEVYAHGVALASTSPEWLGELRRLIMTD